MLSSSTNHVSPMQLPEILLSFIHSRTCSGETSYLNDADFRVIQFVMLLKNKVFKFLFRTLLSFISGRVRFHLPAYFGSSIPEHKTSFPVPHNRYRRARFLCSLFKMLLSNRHKRLRYQISTTRSRACRILQQRYAIHFRIATK